MSVRQRREVLETLAKHFSELKLPAIVTYSGYTKVVPNPVLPRAIRKTYGNWARAVKALQLAHPEIFAPKPAPQPKPAPAPAPKPAPKAPAEPKVAQPAPKPAPAPVAADTSGE
jgi:outer membrane biosynthesis protein TonB